MYTITRVNFDVLKQDHSIHTVFTTYEWVAFLNKNQSVEPVVLQLTKENVVYGWFVGLIARKFGIRILGSPFDGWLTPDMGFVVEKEIDFRAAVEDVVKYAFDDLRCHFIQIHDKKIFFDNLPANCYTETTKLLHIDADKELETILEGFTKNGRRDVRASGRKGISIRKVPFDYDFVDIHYEQLEDVFAKQNLRPSYEKSKLLDLADAFANNQERILALEAFFEDKCIASIFTLGQGEWAYYMGAASFREYQKYLPNEALFWEFISYWHQEGIKHFDLVGYREYKLKYNPEIIDVPVMLFCKYPILIKLKKIAKKTIMIYRRIIGRISKK